ncbi:PPC domain-containing DNA-binding protein [Methanocrinis sp.]|uniref:PPC domain-containing DNA-binding protein n=1 Tax=Methanocrinis sp. TaxID=3101522 RepID=UPI003D09E3A4
MQYSEGRLGRVFVIRLEEGEDLIGSIQRFLAEKGVSFGLVHFLGALREGRLVAGPKEPTVPPGPPFVEDLEGAWEIFGVATVYPGDGGEPSVHIHASAGHSDRALTGCLRERATTYLVVEAAVFEICGLVARRSVDDESGLRLPVLGERL